MNMTPELPPISVVCVYNNKSVLQECLEASVSGRPGVELVAVDNTGRDFGSAGAALNHGASIAAYDYVAFAHQDVYIHSVDALRRAAGLMQSDPRWGVLGPVGADSAGHIVGRIRDRMIMTAEPVTKPVAVESLDEVLFILPRVDLEREPLTTAPELAWHAYSVEYGLRVASRGGLVGVADIPLTHNSLTINLAELDVAHRAIASKYPGLLPVQTTCGRVPGQLVHTTRNPLVATARHAARRTIEWTVVARATRSPWLSPKLFDVRRHIDEIAGRRGGSRLVVFNVVARTGDEWEPVTLSRHGVTVDFHALTLDRVLSESERASKEGSVVVVTDIPAHVVRAARSRLSDAAVGYSLETGFWLTVDPRR